MKITDIALVEVEGEYTVAGPQSEERIANPLDVYPEFGAVPFGAGSQPGERVTRRDQFLEVRTDQGLAGVFGPVDGGHNRIPLLEMRSFLLGRDPLAIEAIWDLLLRRNRHARAGYYMMAMSALDCALWDLKGKALGQPVYRLLGGPIRESVPAYASMLGFSLEPEALVRRAREKRAEGHQAQKWFFRYGPGDGPEGAEQNVAMVRLLREAVGPDYPLMFDAFNSWDVPYALEVGRRIARYRPAWLEEPLPVDRRNGLRTIRTRTGIPVATGEHAYTRWQVKDLLDAGAADVIQADPDWCGGISELMKIAALCSAYDVPLCPHGHSVHAAAHVAAALPPPVLPQVEFLVIWQPARQYLFAHPILPHGGRVRPPERPGLGLEIDDAKVVAKRDMEA
jgi:L-rhamnonate dehydratase